MIRSRCQNFRPLSFGTLRGAWLMLDFLTLHGRPTIKTEYSGIPECALPGQHAAIFELFSKLVPLGAQVLDLASGIGAFPKRLADCGYKVLACDIKPELCR